jgi:hypothetical protein
MGVISKETGKGAGIALHHYLGDALWNIKIKEEEVKEE